MRILKYEQGEAQVLIEDAADENGPPITDESLIELLQAYGVAAGTPVTVTFAIVCPECHCGRVAPIVGPAVEIVTPPLT